VPLAVELRNVSFAYGRGVPVLRDVDLAVAPGELLAVAGPNGGGKTTLVRLALGLERPTRGEALLFGEPAHEYSRRNRLAYLAQRSQLGTDAPATVREVVAAGRLPRTRLLGPLRRADRERIDETIARFGLTQVADRPLSLLSGGQQQRALIAKALVVEPHVLVLDEPTTGVDHAAQEALADLLRELHSELDVTILFVSHEFGAVEPFVERIVLVQGTIVYDGSPAGLPGRWHDPSHVHV
jgi:zinc transport system ATP-binding protein